MQTTPSFLPIPSNGHSGQGQPARQSFPRQPSFDFGQPSTSRQAESSGISAMMRSNGTPPGHASPSSNPHSGFHPGSFGGPLSFSALALGATQTPSSPYSSSMAMSISPPRWAGPGSMGGGFGGGSFVGSVGALGTSFGRQAEGRERELEAKYVKDFTCCGRQLSGLHELLEHYEEEHANLAPDVRLAAINAVQSNLPVPSLIAKRAFSPAVTNAMTHGDAPTTPGMMDIEMDEPVPIVASPAVLLQQASVASLTVNLQPGATPPWSAAFRTLATNVQPPACVPPSVLSYAPPQNPATPQSRPSSQPMTPTQSQLGTPQMGTPTPEQLQAKLLKKVHKKSEKHSRAEEEDDSDMGDKRFKCPIEGCGKVYKQANGLKYHLTRSINSGHGNVAAMGGLMALLDEAKD